MKVLSLSSRTPKDGQCQIRRARNDDWLAIEKLLTFADRQYLALEWWSIQEWLGSSTFLLATDVQSRPVGLMLSITSDGPIAWLRAINTVSEEYLLPLLQANFQAVLAQGGTGLAFLGNEAWIVSRLEQAGFREVNQVVTLRCRGSWPACQGPHELQVRSVTLSDIDAVLAVDHAAFAPMWWYGREILLRALNMDCVFDAAYLKGQCVGYQLSTLRNGRGHIVRLAVHPHWQAQGIGGRLLSEAMRTLDAAKSESVTVNTQADNLASLQLYRRFSFQPVGTQWAVWFRSLA